MTKEQKNSKHPEDRKNFLEWSVFAASVTLVLGILGYLIYHTIIYKPGSPDLYITYLHDPSDYAPHRYFLRVKNEGQETAEEVQIEMVLERDGENLEVGTLTFRYLPKQSAREGWVIFSKNPSEADTLYARVVSYKKP